MGSNLQRRIDRARPGRTGRGSTAYWLVWAGFALFSLAGWLRMVDSIVDYYWLDLAGVFPSPIYISVTGALWGLAGLLVVIWMGAVLPGYRVVGFVVALFFALTYWIDRLLFSRSEGANANQVFALLGTVAGLALVLLVLRPLGEIKGLARPAAKDVPEADAETAETRVSSIKDN